MKHFILLSKSLSPFLLGCLLYPPLVLGQTDSLNSIRPQFEQYNHRSLTEKLFVHTDRSFYIVSEPIWFKIYYVDGTLHQPLDLSKVAYLEVLDKDQNPVLQTKVALQEGKGNGSLVISSDLRSGHYLLRAYTNWMKNFSPDFYFEKPITIVNPFTRPDQPPTAKQSTAYDVQFFPEGGNLVRNMESKVAFRATTPDGKGIAFKGALLNQQNDTITHFEPLKFGIGHFTFTPVSGNEYRVVLQDEQGKSFRYQLPVIHEQGYVMQVRDSTSNLLKITVSARANGSELPYVYLLTHTRQVTKHAEGKLLQNEKAVFLLNKNNLDEGITHLTIFNNVKQPVCERLYFKQPTRQLAIDIQSDKPQYASREKIHLDLSVHTSRNAAEIANLSVAVYLVDSLQAIDKRGIESYLWLSSDLKGTVEAPEYYFENTGKAGDQALDNLMLTHGWSRFRWKDVLQKQPATYPNVPENNGHFIFGKVVDAQTGAPARGIQTFLASPEKRVQLFVSRSDSLGRVYFEVKRFYGSKEIVVQTNTRRDSTYRIEISSPFSEKVSSYRLPSFSFDQLGKNQLRTQLPAKLEAQLLTRSINMQTRNAFMPTGVQLVNIPDHDSLAFYGVPDERYLLDAYTRFPTMEEVMREYVPGVLVRKNKGKFHFRVVDNVHERTVFEEDPLILLDGVPVFDTDKMLAFDPLKIKKLEVMDARYYLGPLIFPGVVSYSTYKGDLAGFELDPRALVLSYEGIQSQREFYAPRYDTPAVRESRVPDFRNLLYWTPDLTTDQRGKQQLSFYSSDQPGTYVVVVQGMNKNGFAGSKIITLEVRKPL